MRRYARTQRVHQEGSRPVLTTTNHVLGASRTTRLSLNEHDNARFTAHLDWHGDPDPAKHQSIYLTASEVDDLYTVLKQHIEPRAAICLTCTAIQ